MFRYFFKSRKTKYRWLFPLAVFLGLGIAALPPFLANILEIVVTKSILRDAYSHTVASIAVLCVVYLLIYLLSNIGFRLVTSALYTRIEKGLIDDMTEASSEEQAPDVEKIINLASDAVNNYYRLFFAAFIPIASFVFAVLYVIYINWLCLIPAMAGILIVFLLSVLFGRRTFKLNKALTESNASLASAMSSFSNIFGSSTYSYSKAQYDTLADASHKQVNSKGMVYAYEGLVESLNGFISSAVCVATYIVAISLCLNDVITGGQMAAITAVGCTITNPFFNARDVIMSRKRNRDLVPQVKEMLR